MFIDKLSKRERYLALATLSVVAIAMVYVFIVRPVCSKWKNINNEIKSKVAMLEKDSVILTNKKTLSSEYEKFSKHARPAKSQEESIADTLVYVESVSRNDSCFVINIKPVGVVDAGLYKEILIDVSAEASIEQFSKFLYDVENPRDNLINVKRFTLSSKSGQPGVLKGTFLISKALLD